MSNADSPTLLDGMSTFDRLFHEAHPLVLGQEHQRDSRPVDGGRWPLSVVLLPDRPLAAALEQVLHEVADLAGHRHFHTGLAESAHFTVRALEHYRDALSSGDVLVERYRATMHAAAARCSPIGLRIVGLTLASGGVMACARPTDAAAEEFMTALDGELGPDGWREADFRRDIWYSMLLHFADDVEHPKQLVDWVADRRDLDLGVTATDTVHLVRFRYDARGGRPLMRPESLGEAILAGVSSESAPAG